MLFKRRDHISWRKRLSISLLPQTSIKRSANYFYLRVLRIKTSHYKIAAGFAMGVFISFSPFIGFHLGLTLLGCFIARASYLAGAVGTVVGNPVTFPFIYAATYFFGRIFVSSEAKFNLEIFFESLKQDFENPIELVVHILRSSEPFIMPLMIGWLTLGTIVALGFFLAIFIAIKKAVKMKLEAKKG